MKRAADSGSSPARTAPLRTASARTSVGAARHRPQAVFNSTARHLTVVCHLAPEAAGEATTGDVMLHLFVTQKLEVPRQPPQGRHAGSLSSTSRRVWPYCRSTMAAGSSLLAKWLRQEPLGATGGDSDVIDAGRVVALGMEPVHRGGHDDRALAVTGQFPSPRA